MEVDVNKLQKSISSLEDRAKHVAIVYPAVAGLCFFLLSWVIMAENARYLDRVLFVLIGAIFGRKFGTATKAVLEERKTLLKGYLELHRTINKPVVVETEPTLVKPEQKVAETMPTTASEAVVKVDIPSDAALPNVPSVAVPSDVKEALKDKGKTTKVQVKKKVKSQA